MPNGEVLASGRTFLQIRNFYTTDTTQTSSGQNGWTAITNYMNGTGAAPAFTYHRFWAQADIAMAAADYGQLFAHCRVDRGPWHFVPFTLLPPVG